ncbi:unnamed protein product, partial [marine sediment metagenome]
GSFNNLVLTGDTSIISSAHEIDLQSVGDSTNYLQFNVDFNDRPVIKGMGPVGGIAIESDSGALVSIVLSEDINNWAEIKWSKTFGHMVLGSKGTIRFLSSGDWDDGIEVKTVAGIPEITTFGDANLKITSSSGEIDFDDENLTTTGDLTAASSTLSGNLDVTGTGTFESLTTVFSVDIANGDFADDSVWTKNHMTLIHHVMVIIKKFFRQGNYWGLCLLPLRQSNWQVSPGLRLGLLVLLLLIPGLSL